jgi:hypothetical protein
MTPFWSRPALGPLLILAGVAAVLFWPAVSLQGVYFIGDANHYLPRLAWVADHLRAGRFPLWNPHLSLGTPMFSGFYPLHQLFFLVLPAGPAYNYDIVFHILLGATGMFALARSWGQSRSGALLAGIVYGFGGFTLGHIQHLVILVGLAWIPVTFVCAERFFETLAPRAIALGAASVGLAVLGGQPQIVAYGLLALGAYAAVRLAQRWRTDRGSFTRVLSGLAAMIVLGLLLGAVFVLPFSEWINFISVEEHFKSALFAKGSGPAIFPLYPGQLIRFVAPFWSGGSGWRPQMGSSLVECALYLGLLPVALAPLGVTRRNWRALFLMGLAAVAVLMALGPHGPLYPLLADVPILTSGRTPLRYMALVQFAVALLAGFGLDAVADGKRRRAAAVMVAVLLAAAIAIVGVSRGDGRPPVFPGGRPDALTLSQPDTLVLLGTLVGCAALVVLLAYARVRGAVALALGFVVADLTYFESQLVFNTVGPMAIYTDNGTAAAIRRDGAEPPRFYSWASYNVSGPTLLYENRDVAGYVAHSGEALIGAMAMRFGLQNFTGSSLDSPEQQDLFSVVGRRGVFDSRSATLVGIYGGCYVIGGTKIAAPELRLVRAGDVNVYRNDVALPRAFLAATARTVANDRAAFAVVKRPDFDPRAEVVIEDTAPDYPTSPDPRASPEASITVDEPDRVVVDASVDRPAWLVLNDSFAPGWRVTVDGRPERVFRANAFVRAVPVPVGRHRVEFAYAPVSVRKGAAISLAALLAVAALVLHRRGPPLA